MCEFRSRQQLHSESKFGEKMPWRTNISTVSLGTWIIRRAATQNLPICSKTITTLTVCFLAVVQRRKIIRHSVTRSDHGVSGGRGLSGGISEFAGLIWWRLRKKRDNLCCVAAIIQLSPVSICLLWFCMRGGKRREDHAEIITCQLVVHCRGIFTKGGSRVMK